MVYLKLHCGWESCVLCGNPTPISAPRLHPKEITQKKGREPALTEEWKTGNKVNALEEK